MNQKIIIGKNVTDIMKLPCVEMCRKQQNGSLVYYVRLEDNIQEAYEGDIILHTENQWAVRRNVKKYKLQYILDA